MTRKLCVFPNDPIKSYFTKGEIKTRYFNPMDLFDEVHVISFTDKEIEEESVKEIAGKGLLKIHCTGIINLTNMKKKKNHVVELVRKINPDIIRAYNPLVQGWIATHCSKELGLPLVISLHGEYDRFRNMIRKQNFIQYLKLLYTSRFIEPFVIKNADIVICVYKVILRYAKKMGAKRIELIYNRIDLTKFKPASKFEKDKPLILSVGRLIKQKNHEIIIHAMQNLDAKLFIIGDGNDYERLVDLIKNLNLQEKISFKKAVPNSEIYKYYQDADLFALAMRTDLESLPIPVLEAMASGLPVVIPKPHSQELSDDLGDGVVLVENNPTSFHKAFQDILGNKKMREDLSKKVTKKIEEFDGRKMEERECKLYEELMQFRPSK